MLYPLSIHHRQHITNNNNKMSDEKKVETKEVKKETDEKETLTMKKCMVCYDYIKTKLYKCRGCVSGVFCSLKCWDGTVNCPCGVPKALRKCTITDISYDNISDTPMAEFRNSITTCEEPMCLLKVDGKVPVMTYIEYLKHAPKCGKVQCSNKGCYEYRYPGHMQTHLDTCEYKIKHCVLDVCEYSGPKCSLEGHYRTYALNHVTMLVSYLEGVKKDLEGVKKDKEHMEKTLEVIRGDYKDLCFMYRKSNEAGKLLFEENQELKKELKVERAVIRNSNTHLEKTKSVSKATKKPTKRKSLEIKTNKGLKRFKNDAPLCINVEVDDEDADEISNELEKKKDINF